MEATSVKTAVLAPAVIMLLIAVPAAVAVSTASGNWSVCR